MFVDARRLLTLSFIMVVLVTVAGCARKAPAVKRTDNAYSQTRDNVVLSVEKLDRKECRKLFGTNVLRRGYQPLRITVCNDAPDEVLLLRAVSLDLPLVPASLVAERAQIPVLNVVFAPAYLSALFLWQGLIPVAALGIWLAHHNQQIAQAVTTKVLDGDRAIEILPFERMTRICYVPVALPLDEFSLHIFKMQEKSFVPFTVHL